MIIAEHIRIRAIMRARARRQEQPLGVCWCQAFPSSTREPPYRIQAPWWGLTWIHRNRTINDNA